MYRALALDLDGTLLSGDGTLCPAVAARLRRLRDRSVSVLLVSGRMEPAVEPFWAELGLDTPIVSYNGARIAVPGRPPLHETKLEVPLAREVARYCLDRDLALNIYVDGRLWVFEETPEALWYSSYFRIPLQRLGRDADLPGAPTKMLVTVAEAELDRTFGTLQSAFGHRAALTTSSRRFVEVLPAGTDKGAAIRRLADALGIPLHAWIAVGDGANDLEMLRAAGLGVAVENGEPGVKAAAALVVPPLPAGGLEVLEPLLLPAAAHG